MGELPKRTTPCTDFSPTGVAASNMVCPPLRGGDVSAILSPAKTRIKYCSLKKSDGRRFCVHPPRCPTKMPLRPCDALEFESESYILTIFPLESKITNCVPEVNFIICSNCSRSLHVGTV